MRDPILVVALNGVVIGLDRNTGAERWRNQLPGGGTEEVFLAITRDFVIASADGGRIFCLDYATGSTRWSAETETSGRASFVVDGQQIVVAKDGYLDSFSLDGQRLWKQNLKGLGTGRVALGLPGNVAQADDYGER